MDWLGILQTIDAAGDRARRESERQEQETHRELAKLEQAGEQVLDRVESFEARLQSNPIRAFDLHYAKDTGLQAKAFHIDVAQYFGRFGLKVQDGPGISMEKLEVLETPDSSLTVNPLDIILTRWATLVPFEISHNDPEFFPRVNWGQRADRSGSSVLLVDEENSEYYDPIASDSIGEVLSGRPRTLLVAFEPFRRPTGRIQIRVSNIKIGPGSHEMGTFSFRLTDPEMVGQILELQESPTLRETVEEQLRSEEARGKEQIKKQASGCMVLLFLLSSGISCVILAIRSL